MPTLRKPNAVCRECGSEYYVCKYCLKTNTWRTFVCSLECFNEYTKKTLAFREKQARENNTTYSDEELKKIKETPLEQVVEETKQDLKDYFDENKGKTLSQVLDIVNDDIKSAKKTRSKKKEVVD